MKREILRPLSLLVSCAALALATNAHATTPPSPWDIVRDPQARPRYELHAFVSRLFAARDEGRRLQSDSELADTYVATARDVLEAADAEHSPDPQLRFDLGHVYQMIGDRHQDPADFRRAATVLESAIALAPDHPAAEDALLWLATCYARTDTVKEVDAYERLLAVAESPRTRAVAYLNRSEAQMRLGHLDKAVEDARYAVELDASPSDTALANMDLAVELDRYGDGYGALRAAEAGVQGLPHVVTMLLDDGDDKSVFFVPDYDKHWYRAVALSVLARACDVSACIDSVLTAELHLLPLWPRGPQELRAAGFWRLATLEWGSYLRVADQSTPWIPLARRREAEAKKKLIAAGAKVSNAFRKNPTMLED